MNSFPDNFCSFAHHCAKVSNVVQLKDKTGLRPTKTGIGPGVGLVSFGLGLVGLVLVLRKKLKMFF